MGERTGSCWQWRARGGCEGEVEAGEEWVLEVASRAGGAVAAAAAAIAIALSLVSLSVCLAVLLP